jgi:hypothetical protein
MDLQGIEPWTTPMLREYYTTKPQARFLNHPDSLMESEAKAKIILCNVWLPRSEVGCGICVWSDGQLPPLSQLCLPSRARQHIVSDVENALSLTSLYNHAIQLQ